MLVYLQNISHQKHLFFIKYIYVVFHYLSMYFIELIVENPL